MSIAAFVGNMGVHGLIQDYQEQKTWHWSRNGGISDLAVLPDRRIIIVGGGVARLLPDGPADPSFHRLSPRILQYPPPLGYSQSSVERTCVAVLPNGDMFVAGNSRIGIIRPDGSDLINLTRVSTPSGCDAVAVQADGRVLLGGSVANSRGGLARYLQSLKADDSFHPAVEPIRAVPSIVLDRRGRILVAGYLKGYDGGWITKVARLNPDGTLDKSFEVQFAQAPFRDDSTAFALLSDGSMLVASWSGAGDSVTPVEHLDENGHLMKHSRLVSALKDRLVLTMLPTADGGVIAGGNGVIRLRPDGTVDSRFDGRSRQAIAMWEQGDQLLILQDRGQLSRLNSDGSPDTSFRVSGLEFREDERVQ